MNRKFQIGLTVLFIGCVAFVACERAEHMMEPMTPIESDGHELESDGHELESDGHELESDGHELDKYATDLGVSFDAPATAGRASPSFESDIAPILTTTCALAGCHVADGPHGIDLTTYETLQQGGEDGVIVIAGDARASELVEEVVEGKMPPPDSGFSLEPAHIQLIIDWVTEGAQHN